MENAYQRKIAKYSSLGRILPLVIGSLGSWNPRNEEIRSILGIDGRSWGAFRFKARLAAIQGSMEMVCAHFHYGATNPEDEENPKSTRPNLLYCYFTFTKFRGANTDEPKLQNEYIVTL
ncbi:hypothetical protein OUZ56_033759 [Daphnia magna]|uniref:Uncharacterized protein n=1 Tax=Daphnia magna TaxID=35525 RepID=A0ABR0BB19_9CRUS|nr:hypothetical protein OUZ56_033759 [Daphnia magna]